jgi:hypothetical protein
MGLTSTENGCSTTTQTGTNGLLFCQHPTLFDRHGGLASAHFWANKLISMGHNVKLMAPQFVKPYVKTHDAADAEAFVKPSLDLTCGSCRSKPLSSSRIGTSPECQSSEPHKPIKSGRIWHCRPRGIQQLQRRLPELVEDADNPPVLFRTQLSTAPHGVPVRCHRCTRKQIEQCYRLLSASVSARSLVLALLPPAR